MDHASQLLGQPHETIYGVLAERARGTSRRVLASLALGSGIVALVAVSIGRGSWIVLGACYSVWSFAGWGLLFPEQRRYSVLARSIQYLMVASATVIVIAIVFAVYGRVIGTDWMP